MGDDTRMPVLSPADYDAIESAVMETARGRWFLAEYARRNRHSDTTTLLRALDRIEQAMTRDKPGHDSTRLRRELLDMADVIARTRRDVGASVAEAAGLTSVSADRAFDDLVAASDKADAEVMAAAERVQEIAWAFREGKPEGAVLDELNQQALDLYRASHQHALTTNRARSLVATLKLVETRVAALVGSWADTVAMVETSVSVGVENRRETVLDTAPPRIRDDIAFVDRRDAEYRREADMRAPAEVAPVEAARPPLPSAARPAPAAADPRVTAFAAIDALSTEDKLALFA